MNPMPFPSSVLVASSLLRSRSESTGGLFDWGRVLGRVVEVSEAGCFGALSALVGLLTQAQALGEQIAWVETGTHLFFPPDLAFRGLDVEAFSVVLAPTPAAGLRAADVLVRSGAFGLVVVDWAGREVEEVDVGRLARLVDQKGSAVIFLTRKKEEAPSLATQISLRGCVAKTSDGLTEWVVTKDKRAGPPSRQRIQFHGPFGLY